MATNTVKLKLLVDSKSRKVLFAEAGKDIVDILFNILSLPVGTVTRLVTKKRMVGSLGNLYDSIETLADDYLQQTANKDTLLKPIVSTYASIVPLLLPDMQHSTSCKLFRRSNYGTNCRAYISNDPRSVCPGCNTVMNHSVTFVHPASKASPSDWGGYVKGDFTYIVTDDLVVRQMSTLSSLTLLKIFNVKDVGVLEEKVIDMGMDLGLKLLKASMQSKTVLADVFLGKKVSK